RREDADRLAADLERRAAALDAREAAIRESERTVVALQAELDLQRASLDRRDRQSGLEQRVEERHPEPEAPPPSPRPAVPGARWDLRALERLVEEQGGAHPDRIDEWRAYLVSLRTVAET